MPRCRLHTCSGWLRVCCSAFVCYVRAGHVVAGVAARRHMIRPEERVLIIISVVVDRSYMLTFLYHCVWCCYWSVHHFGRAWSAEIDRLKTVPLRDVMQKHTGVTLYEECV